MKTKLKDYLNNQLTTSQVREVEDWLLENMDKDEIQEQFHELFEEIKGADSYKNINCDYKYVVGKADNVLKYKKQKKNVSKRNKMLILGQSILILLLGVFALKYRSEIIPSQEWVEVYASNGQVKEIVLPDSSKIWIHNDTKLTYPDKFIGEKRQVFVSGEVFADISTDKSKPFIISNCEVDVLVYGTKFNYRGRNEESDVEISLLEGSVALKVDSVVHDLTPGDRVVANRTTGEVSRSTFNPQEYVPWTNKRILTFVNEPLFKIAKELERSFNVKILIADSEILTTKYFANFINEESIDQILNSLTYKCGVKYKMKNGVYVIYK